MFTSLDLDYKYVVFFDTSAIKLHQDFSLIFHGALSSFFPALIIHLYYLGSMRNIVTVQKWEVIFPGPLAILS